MWLIYPRFYILSKKARFKHRLADLKSKKTTIQEVLSNYRHLKRNALYVSLLDIEILLVLWTSEIFPAFSIKNTHKIQINLNCFSPLGVKIRFKFFHLKYCNVYKKKLNTIPLKILFSIVILICFWETKKYGRVT